MNMNSVCYLWRSVRGGLCRLLLCALCALCWGLAIAPANAFLDHVDATTEWSSNIMTSTVWPLKPLNDSRVNGGELVTEAVPFQVSLQKQRRGKWQHFCGGSIISARHVLTAAHCVHKNRVEDVTVVCGTLTWQLGGERHRVVDQRVHPQFAMTPHIVNDIAVLKVTPPFNLRKHNVGTVALNGLGRVGDKVPVRLTGWGSTSPSVSTGLPQQLQMLNYNTITNEECAKRGFKVTNSELCAFSAKGKGACMGDSGGPLVTPQPVPQLVGIVSHGTATCAQGRPDVYTRVSSFLPYINKAITSEMP